MRTRTLVLAVPTIVAMAVSATAQQTSPPATPTPAPSADPVTLPAVSVFAPMGGPQPPISPDVEKFALPQTIETIDQKKIADTINIVDTEDALKYMPSLFVRKRNYGDTQPTFSTRTWGINSSARNLVYVDDIPISALIGNNNTNGAPRWGMVSPEEIKGLDMLYGPFAAAYPGNSMGGVLLITTRMPETFEATAKQTGAFQTFDMYKTNGTFGTSNSAATVGGKFDRISFFLAGDRLESSSQPLAFVTNGTTPGATTGTIPQLTKNGLVANVVGAGGLLRSSMTNLKAKVAVDVTDWLRATYMVGYWTNNTQSSVQTYLTDAAGNQTFGGVSAFANNFYNLQEQHLMNAATLKTDTKGDWDFEAIATWYSYMQDLQRNPAGVLSGANFTTNGLIARLDGTGWSTQDLKGIWRPFGPGGAHEVSFGFHRDQYTLNNPTYNTPNWITSSDSGNGTLFTYGKGTTETLALWLQDAWNITPSVRLTLGARGEQWKAYDGFNFAGTLGVFQPPQQSTNFSPKASVFWQFDPTWNFKVSFGQATRYPTVSELYQIVSTGSVFAVPNPNLLPESQLSFEFAIERQTRNSRFRLSFFEDDTSNALISQTNLINNTFVTTFQNVGLTRNRGVEVVAELNNLFIPGFSLSNSLTYVDSRIISNPGFQSATGTLSTGQHVPYVPALRNTTVATYRPTESVAFTVAGRYQSMIQSSLDNTDSVSHVMGAFDSFFVVDAHARYQFNKAISAELGVDNLNNDSYFLFHPFPGRTFIASLKVKL
jgi:iron complex outermembrane receptor protein